MTTERRSRKSKAVPSVPDVADVLTEATPISSTPMASSVGGECAVPEATSASVVDARSEVEVRFEQLLSTLDEELTATRAEKTRDVGLIVWKNLIRDIKKLKTVTAKLSKRKRRTGNTNSGFSKPLPISKEMARFAKWDASELKSRTDVTRFLYAYIRENNLQNPEKRTIIVPDKKLARLLSYDVASEETPLTYTNIQTRISKLFPKPAPTV